MGALIALIVVGFLMATLGVALLFLGEVPFLGGKRIPALRSRLIGAIMAMFLPMALLLRQASNLLFGADAVDPLVVTWSLFGLCWLLIGVVLFRVVVPKREPRKLAKQATPAKKDAAEKSPAKKKAPGPAPESLAWMDAEPEPAPEPVKQQTPAPAPAPAPAKKAPSKKAPKPAADDNPFDFS